MAEPHLDHPGEFNWLKGHGPLPVLGPCPHTECCHDEQSVIAWGPDYVHYELVTCDVDDQCDGGCRAWSDGSAQTTSPWLHVSAVTGEPVPALAGPSGPNPTDRGSA